MRSSQRICAGSMLFCLLVISSAATGTTIGPGSGNILANPPTYPGLSLATLDIHRIPTPLAAGNYSVGSFSFHNVTQSASPGSVVPFLARLTDPGVDQVGPTRSYQTIWVGPPVAVSSVTTVHDPANLVTISYAGSQQFSLGAAADIFAGLYTTGAGRVAYRVATAEEFPARTDHDETYSALSGAGQNIANLSHIAFSRIFGFHLAVDPAGGPPAVPGDFDSDSDVDGADFVVWQTNFPALSGKTLATGDADADGDVDGADFVAWQTHFPTPGSGGASPVPEPTAGILAMIGAAAALLWVRRPLAT